MNALVLLAALLSLGAPGQAGLAPVPGGRFRPAFPASPAEREISVAPFLIDRTPVTNARFLSFVKRHPEWRRDRVPRAFAEARYLGHWAGPLVLGPDVRPGAPVVNVSWFAARAFCAEKGLRLPFEREWELAASASETMADARSDPAFVTRSLEWYAHPTPASLPPVGARRPNLYGLHDLDGLVWEWVLDFGAAMLDGDGREAGRGGGRFCGGGAVTLGDQQDYVAFMRLAFHNSLRADYAVANLGFRCAADAKEPQ